jgi:precorrin-6B methylase 2
MSNGPSFRRIGPGLGYADGAEDEIAAILRTAGDRSSGSTELAEHIVDWPTRYHFSYQRANLLRPLHIAAGARVLDVGAGSGALTRYLGEQGARVVALEGNPARAEAAALRCQDLDDVEILCGTLHDLDATERFDVVLLVGVLEYAGAALGGGGGAPAMLRQARSHLHDDGAVIVAIENQLGLKYLLGAREDHLGRPWVGVDGYPGQAGVRTWTRRMLSSMLDGAGLEHQHWLAPFPDYKLPTVVIDERLYQEADAAELIDQLVLEPVVCLDQTPVRLADAAAAHGVFAEAGLAADVANSFLIVAGPQRDGVERLVGNDALAWLFGTYRMPPWRRQRVLTTGRKLVTVGDTERRHRGWLAQDPGVSRPFHLGRTLGQDALAALRRHDLDALAAVLRRWRDELEARAVELQDVPNDPHPFVRSDSSRGLPDGHLDVGLSNFIEVDGRLVFIDDEWRTDFPVDLEVAEYRALWVLAREAITSGIEHPWGDFATVDDLVNQLLGLAGLTIDERVVKTWREGEIALQSLVTGETPERLRAGWLDGSLRRIDLRVDAQLERLRDEELPRLTEKLAQLEADRNQLAEQRVELAGQHDHLQGVVAALEAEVSRLRTVSGFVSDFVRRRPRFRAVARRLRLIDRPSRGAENP